MKKIILSGLFAVTIFVACKKSGVDETPMEDFNAKKDVGITDFVNKVAIAGYTELKIKADVLNNSIITLNATTTDANLTASKNAWRDMRSTWERCEGYLFGPVEDDNYDPETDTWPVDYVAMNALLADNTHALDVTDINSLQLSLKGYHPIEYMLWGQNGNKTAAQFTARQKLYMVSLSAHLQQKATALKNSWLPTGGNYSAAVLNAGKGSTLFVKKQDAYISIANGMSDICGEVGDGKMKEPFDAMDPNIVESPFSGNSIPDFQKNITGAYNVYLGKFNEDGAGLEDLVKMKNSALDAELQSKFNAAISSFNSITVPFEKAIFTQRVQCQNTMNAINALATVIDTKLKPFIIQNITD